MKISGYVIQAKDEASLNKMKLICLRHNVTFVHDSYYQLSILEFDMKQECEQELRNSRCYTSFDYIR